MFTLAFYHSLMQFFKFLEATKQISIKFVVSLYTIMAKHTWKLSFKKPNKTRETSKTKPMNLKDKQEKTKQRKAHSNRLSMKQLKKVNQICVWHKYVEGKVLKSNLQCLIEATRMQKWLMYHTQQFWNFFFGKCLFI